MNIEQIYTGCLSQGAYYIENGGEVAIIDPLREVAPYIERAKKDKATIKYIFESHFHADFVSGHVTLAEKTGAKIIYGPNADPSYEVHVAHDEEIFQLGDATIKLLHTPGHTMESSCFLLIDKDGKEQALFSGDTLFLGDVGRPDLAQKSASMTQDELAGLLFDSLRIKIMPLPDDILVYPAHGAGSACGKNMMTETVDSLGNQKKTNYALRVDMTREEFIQEVTDGLLPPPAYFPLNVKLNKEGYVSIDTVLETGLKALSADEFETIANSSEALMLDVRDPQEYAKGHIPNSIFIGLDGSFSPWVGALIIDVQQPIILIAPVGREEEAITRLSRVGFDQTKGYLEGGFETWMKAGKTIETVVSIPPAELKNRYNKDIEPIFDVRKEGEYASEHIEGSLNAPLSKLNDHLASFPKEGAFYVHCKGGYRSMIASSILKSRGIHNIIEVQGGFDAIKETGIALTDFVCPTTL